MKIAQVSLAVPDEIYTDIMKGTLEIAAGVVRDNKGVIRKHLPKVASVAKDNKALKAVAANKNAMQIVKNLKVYYHRCCSSRRWWSCLYGTSSQRKKG